MLDVENIMYRAMMPFIVAGEVGSQLKSANELRLEAPKVEILIRRRNLNDSYFGIMKQFLPSNARYKYKDDLADKDHLRRIEYEYKGVPVEIRIIHKDYAFLDNPESVFYRTTEFLVPNPFERYWKVRGVLS